MRNTSTLMHILVCILVCMCVGCLPCMAQILTFANHCPQATDSITLYAIPYQTMADSGEHCVWDLGQAGEQADKAENADFFPIPSDTVALGVHWQHRNRYYQYANDTLYYLEYEDARQKTTYERPLPVLKYPFAYGDMIFQHFRYTEDYAHKRTYMTEGTLSVKGKATGTLIVAGDTIGQALYVETVERYKKIGEDTLNMECKAGQWYIEAVRYPIIASRQWLCNDSVIYARMWYYPTTVQRSRKQRQRQTEALQETADIGEQAENVQVYYTNPVYETLAIRYGKGEGNYLAFALYSHTGTLLYQSDRLIEAEGTLDIPMSNLPQGVYTLYVETDQSRTSHEIIKQ